MKKNILTFLLGIICPILLTSCSDDNSINVSKYETPEFWSDNNFQKINDSFNPFRSRIVENYYPYFCCSVEDQTRSATDTDTFDEYKPAEVEYFWIEVLYPKNNPQDVVVSKYRFCSLLSFVSFISPEHFSSIDYDSYVRYSRPLYKDNKPFGALEFLYEGRVVYNNNGKRTLLYNYPRLAYCLDQIYTCNNSNDTHIFELLSTFKDMEFTDLMKFYCESENGIIHYWANDDPYGGKILGNFGCLSSFLLPVNGPCNDEMKQEIVGLRKYIYTHDKEYPDTCFFLYKNSQSPAAQYLPESVWDINDFSLWK